MQKIAPQIRFIDILAPGQTPLKPDMPTISSKNLRNLAKIFSALDAFVCADTGPMHLASASTTPTIALFNATDPAYYGPLGEKDKTLQINELNHYALKVHRFLSGLKVRATPIPVSSCQIPVGWIPMVLQILLHHLFTHIPGTPYSVSYRPQMFAPVFL